MTKEKKSGAWIDLENPYTVGVHSCGTMVLSPRPRGCRARPRPMYPIKQQHDEQRSACYSLTSIPAKYSDAGRRVRQRAAAVEVGVGEAHRAATEGAPRRRSEGRQPWRSWWRASARAGGRAGREGRCNAASSKKGGGSSTGLAEALDERPVGGHCSCRWRRPDKARCRWWPYD